MMRTVWTLIAIVSAVPLWAADLVKDELIARMSAADVVFVGEIHDNPRHHLVQADIITRLHPSAIVWEMLTDDMAQAYAGLDTRTVDTIEEALNWAESGWPSFQIYAPVFTAAGDRPSYSAQVSRERVRDVIETGPAAVLGTPEAVVRFGLEQPLPEQEMEARLDAQMAAHCDAMERSLMPMMVAIQRARDARLAQAATQALQDHGGPVVVITGNGHARKDWGAPVYLIRAVPDVEIFALGQSEERYVDGQFDAVIDSPAVERSDPCAVFRSGN